MQTLMNGALDQKRQIPYFPVGLGILVLGGLLFFLVPDDTTSLEKSALHTGEVKRGPLVREIRAPGRFAPNSETWLTARVDARVKTKHLEPGARVEPDSLILELSAPELTQEYQTALLDVKVAEARVEATRAQQHNVMQQQKADLELIEIERDLAIAEASAQETLAIKRIITDFEYQASLLRVQRLKTQLRINQQQLLDLPNLQRSLLRVEQAQLEQVQLRAGLLADQVDSLFVRAGVQGVLQNVPLEEGQRVITGAELARVSNQEDLKAELNVQEAQAKDLRLGQLVIIDTRRSKVRGRIARIDPGVSNGTVLVDVQFDGPLPEEARPELRVDGVIEIERLDDVLFISKPRMWRPTPSAELYRLEGDSIARKTNVTYGIHSVANVQLLAGLEEGDVIILSDVSAMNNAPQININ
jgi:HlyD family secretion protein